MGLISNGTTIFDNGSMGSGFGGSLKFISKQTASSSASISFTSGIDSTYKEYVFYFVNISADYASTGNEFTFQTSTNGGSSYGVTLTSTAFRAYHNEGDTLALLNYGTAHDLAQSTNFQNLTSAGGGLSNDADHGASGYLHIFNPSSTTFVKHWLSSFAHYNRDGYSHQGHHAGYFNTTTALNAVQFKMISGNIDAGDILLYGVN